LKREEISGLRELVESFENAEIIKKGEYEYFVHPLTDGIPEINPRILDIASDIVVRILSRYDFDKILTVEALGIPLATAVAIKTKKTLSIARKRVYGVRGEVVVKQKTGYSEGIISISGVRSDEKIAVVDDVLSTGGTLRAVAEGIEKLNGKIVCSVFLVEKENFRKHSEFNFPIESVMKIKIVNGKVVVSDLHYCCYESAERY